MSETEKTKDKISDTSKKAITAGGAAIGGVGAGVAVAAAHLSSVPILTTVLSWAGVTVVAATPVGWVIGASVVGAAVMGSAAYAVVKISSHNGKMEGKQEADAEAREAEEEMRAMKSEKTKCTKEEF